MREQARCLAGRFDVTVLTPRFPSLADQLRLRWGPTLLKNDDQGINTWRIRKLKIPTLRRWDADHVLVYYRKFAEAIRRGFSWYVAEHGLPELIHAHVVLPAGWVAVELGARFGIPVVLTEHSEPFAMHLKTEKQRGLARDILQRVDRLIAVSPALSDTMADFVPAVRASVIGNLIDTEFFTLAPCGDSVARTFRFFMLGIMEERKGTRFLLQATRALLERGYTNFEVYLGGDGPMRPAFETQARELAVGDRCRFLGMLGRPQVREQMQACNVFVLPSLGETFGIVLGEAMACGKPVLSTRCGGPEFLVTAETGVLTSPGDVPALTDAMASFLDGRHAFKADRIRESIVGRFGAAAFLEKHELLYEETIRQYRASRAAKAG